MSEPAPTHKINSRASDATRGTRRGLPETARVRSAAALDRLLVHTLAMRDLYKQAHWQASGPTFQSLHSLFERHHDEQLDLIDRLGERVQSLGGTATVLARDVASRTSGIAQAPRHSGEAATQLRRLLDAHDVVIVTARQVARETSAAGDDGSSDLVVGAVLRTHEMQAWVIEKHLDGWPSPQTLHPRVGLDEALALTFPASDPIAVFDSTSDGEP